MLVWRHARMQLLTERPACACHGEPQGWAKDPRKKTGGYWRCIIRKRATDKAYRGTEKGRATVAQANARHNPRRVRLSAGGIAFLIGMAPTADDALHIRTKIKREAPSGTVRIA